MATEQLVTFTIDSKTITAPRGESLLKIAHREGIDIPNLCHHEAVEPYGACRVCLVEVRSGKRSRITTSCNYPALQGIAVTTRTERVDRLRRLVIELHLARAPKSRKLNSLAEKYGVKPGRHAPLGGEDECILCGLCTRVCDEVVGAHAITLAGRGYKRGVCPPYKEIAQSCIGCGACVYVCPTDCIGLRQSIELRRIERWDRDLPMTYCKNCGREVGPTFQLRYMGKLSGRPDDFFDLCLDCRK